MPRDEVRASLRKIWGGMKKRCYDKSSKDYKNYGAKGVRICDEWLNDFESFYHWALAHGYKRGLTIDRICNSRGYSPGNCRWVTRKAQGFNKSTNTLLEARGRIQTLTQWCNEVGIRDDTLVRRLQAGWSVEDAIFKPVKPYRRKAKKE